MNLSKFLLNQKRQIRIPQIVFLEYCDIILDISESPLEIKKIARETVLLKHTWTKRKLHLTTHIESHTGKLFLT